MLFCPSRKKVSGGQWLTWALRTGGCLTQANIVAIAVQALGQEVGFLDGLARLHLTYDHDERGAPAAVVVKVPSREAAYRQIGNRYHAYERELRFYGDVAPGSPIRLPRCFYRGMDQAADAYLLVLEDLGSLTAGDQVRGLTQAQAQAAVETIGRLHACWWETPARLGAIWRGFCGCWRSAPTPSPTPTTGRTTFCSMTHPDPTRWWSWTGNWRSAAEERWTWPGCCAGVCRPRIEPPARWLSSGGGMRRWRLGA